MALLTPPPTADEQRVNDKIVRESEQRVINDAPIITVPRITDAPSIIEARNPTAKKNSKETPRVHCWVTQNNTPGIVAPPIAPAPYIPIPSGANQRIVTRHTINLLTANKQEACSLPFTPTALLLSVIEQDPPHFEHFTCPMVHPTTGKTISNYKKLMHNPVTANTWQTAFEKDFGGMAQGDNKTVQKGTTNAMFVMTHDEIRHVLCNGKKFTYGNPVVDYRPQKDNPHWICITAGGNLITYESSPSVQTADLDTAKLYWNSVISTKGAKYMCLNIKNFYLTARLEYFEYMHMPLNLFPIWIQNQYNLKTLAYKGYVHLEIRHTIWGLPQAGILANKRLRCKLVMFGYFEHVNTPGLWYHKSRPISFTLVVNDFGIKYVNKKDVDHLVASIKLTYKLTKDWTGNLYWGIALDWDYVNRTVNILMPGYIKKKLQEYNHVRSKNIQTCPYTPAPKQLGLEAQCPLPAYDSPPINKKGIKRVQQIVRSILYYARAVDMMVLMALSMIAIEQTKSTKQTMAKCMQLLDYLAYHADAKVHFYASDMIMNIHLDASYLSKGKAHSQTCGHFFIGWLPKDDEPIWINGAFHIGMNVISFVIVSAAEAELGALFHNCQTGIIF
jgi:hypothetical protein